MYVQGQHCCLYSSPEKPEKGTGEALLTAAVRRLLGCQDLGEQSKSQSRTQRTGRGWELALTWPRGGLGAGS